MNIDVFQNLFPKFLRKLEELNIHGDLTVADDGSYHCRNPFRLGEIYAQTRTFSERLLRAACTVLGLLEVLGWNADPEKSQELSWFSQPFEEHLSNMYHILHQYCFFPRPL
jgi:hypothetical protein